MLSEEVMELKGKSGLKESFVYIKIEDKIEVGVIKEFRLTKKITKGVFKKSRLIVNYEDTIFDTTFEHLCEHHATMLSELGFNPNLLLFSNKMNDYLAVKIVDAIYHEIITLLNEEFYDFDCYVFNISKLKYQGVIIKEINGKFKTKNLFYVWKWRYQIL